MPATKRGVYHNLRESKYTASDSEVVFFFSSRFYMEKFLSEYKAHREKIENYFGKYIDADMNYSLFSDVQCYKLIEKRGFYAWVKGVNVTWQELDEYALAKMTRKNTLDWCEIQKPKLTERIKIME